MTSTSMKHNNFVTEPIIDRPVTDVPGVGPATAKLLKEHDIDKAEQLLGDYLKHKCDEDAYMNILEEEYTVPNRYARQIHQAMKELTDNTLS